MALKLYIFPLSQPARTVLIFSKANGIEFEEVVVDLGKGQQHTPEFAEINPMKQVPALVHGDFKLFEGHAILIYLATAFSGVADHWYPSAVRERAKIHSVLNWQHSNLRRGSVGIAFNSIIALGFGLPLNPEAAAEGEKLMSASLATIESFWLEGDGPFLFGKSQPSIADLALVCDITQLEVVDESDRERILGPHKRILKWIEDVKNATAPHFDDIHLRVEPIKENLKKLKARATNH